MMKRNRVKEKLMTGQTALGVSIMIPSPQIVEMVGKLGFDWVLIDREHGSISRENMELMIMAAESCGVAPIVRPPSSRPEAILEVLDSGAMGVQVPHVSTAQAAREVVQAARYHPVGCRGLAVGTRAASYGYGLAMERHVQEANEQILVCIQLEDTEALSNLDEIAKVDGIDVLFIGPSDLSQAMGYPGEKDHPKVQQAIERAVKATVAVGRIAGTAGKATDLLKPSNRGVQYFYTHLTSLLESASRDFLASAERKGQEPK
ncbi:MAG: HpcH/HpaI aldolase family protein [Bacillota bacterium]